MTEQMEVSYSRRMDGAAWERFYEERQEWNLYKHLTGSDLKVRQGPGSFEKAVMIECVNGEKYAGVAQGDLDFDRSHPYGNPVVHLNFLVREGQMDGCSVPGLDEKMEELGFQAREPRRISE